MDLSLLKPLPHEGSREASQRLPNNVGPKDSYTQQTPQSGPCSFGKEPCVPGPKESGQDSLWIHYSEAGIVLGDGVMSRGDGSAQGSRWVGNVAAASPQGIPCCLHLTP